MSKEKLEEIRFTPNHDEEVKARIASRAYELYESRGREEDRELDDWLQAEREIVVQLAEERTIAAVGESGPAEQGAERAKAESAGGVRTTVKRKASDPGS